jgi:sulfur carrier protein
MLLVNGDDLDWTPGLTVRGVLKAKNYTFPLVIVTVNDAPVERKAFDTTPVPDGAVVQVIHLISGG